MNPRDHRSVTACRILLLLRRRHGMPIPGVAPRDQWQRHDRNREDRTLRPHHGWDADPTCPICPPRTAPPAGALTSSSPRHRVDRCVQAAPHSSCVSPGPHFYLTGPVRLGSPGHRCACGPGPSAQPDLRDRLRRSSTTAGGAISIPTSGASPADPRPGLRARPKLVARRAPRPVQCCAPDRPLQRRPLLECRRGSADASLLFFRPTHQWNHEAAEEP
jgi:hypothetical protein